MVEPINVKIDIAGFYYAKTIKVAPGTTLEAAMATINNKTGQTTDNGQRCTLSYLGDERRFLVNLKAAFLDAPKPRQARTDKDDLGDILKLPAGTYGAADNTRFFTNSGTGLLTWQYYVNAATFGADGKIATVREPLNQEPAGGTDPTQRLIVPFGAFPLKQDCLVTWRLIVIMVGPDVPVEEAPVMAAAPVA